ncbi:MAG: hypothetical protein JWO12_3197, partial [Frankiales bacterium]|nr:hypothetical protein [Frankiales bacterium]
GSAAGGTIKALSGSTARAYSVQLAKVELPGSYDVIEREHGGSYVAAGNGPYASISYRTSEPQNSVMTQVRLALEQAGYAVRPAADDNPFFKDVTRLDGTATGRSIEALIGVGEVYDEPFGHIAPVAGTTGVLLVVEDHGRSR